MINFSKVELSEKNGVATIRLNSPESMNALDDQLFAELSKATEEAARDDEIGALILTGSGRAFCAGGDLKKFAAGFESQDAARGYMQKLGEWVRLFAEMEKPTVAAVNGHAAGAGFCISMHADFVVAAEGAKFNMAFANVGLIADLGGLYALPRLIGARKTKELVMLGRSISAAEALELGLINRVAAADELEAEAFAIASLLASGPRLAHAAAKKLINRSFELSLADLLREEAEAQARCMMSEDHKNAVASFLKKEKPRFTGK